MPQASPAACDTSHAAADGLDACQRHRCIGQLLQRLVNQLAEALPQSVAFQLCWSGFSLVESFVSGSGHGTEPQLGHVPHTRGFNVVESVALTAATSVQQARRTWFEPRPSTAQRRV
jgi:hypothetical protein